MTRRTDSEMQTPPNGDVGQATIKERGCKYSNLLYHTCKIRYLQNIFTATI